MCFFSPLKKEWQHVVTQYQYDNGKVVDKRSFSRVFHAAYQKVVKLSTLVNAFRASGIYPVDRHAIDSKKLAPSNVYTSEPFPHSTTDASLSFRSGVSAST